MKNLLITLFCLSLSASVFADKNHGSHNFYMKNYIGTKTDRSTRVTTNGILIGGAVGYEESNGLRGDISLDLLSNGSNHTPTIPQVGTPIFPINTSVQNPLTSHTTAFTLLLNLYKNVLYWEDMGTHIFLGGGLGGALINKKIPPFSQSYYKITYAFYAGCAKKLVQNVHLDLTYSFRDMLNANTDLESHKAHILTLGIRFNV